MKKKCHKQGGNSSKRKGHFCIALSKEEGHIYVPLLPRANTSKRSKTFRSNTKKRRTAFLCNTMNFNIENKYYKYMFSPNINF